MVEGAVGRNAADWWDTVVLLIVARQRETASLATDRAHQDKESVDWKESVACRHKLVPKFSARGREG